MIAASEIRKVPALCLEKDGVEIRKGLLSKADIEAVKADIDLESRKLREYGVRNLTTESSSLYSAQDFKCSS